MICSSVKRFRFIVWSSSKGQTPVQTGLNGGGNVSAATFTYKPTKPKLRVAKSPFDMSNGKDNERSSRMRIIDSTVLSGFARKTAESASDFASVVRNLIKDVRDCYRPELHYMRGPGPKRRAKHQPRLRFNSKIAPLSRQDELSPVYIRGRDCL
jgi:hypothetical protein